MQWRGPKRLLWKRKRQAFAKEVKRLYVKMAKAEPAGFRANVFRELNRRDPNFAEARSNLGLVFLETAEFRKVQTELRGVNRLKPLYAEAHYNFALAWKQDEKEQVAQVEFDKAFQISPELRNAPRP